MRDIHVACLKITTKSDHLFFDTKEITQNLVNFHARFPFLMSDYFLKILQFNLISQLVFEDTHPKQGTNTT